MVVDVAATKADARVTLPQVLVDGGFVQYTSGNPRTYDVAPDGRFLMIERNDAAAPAALVLVRNWFEELKRLVPLR